MHYESLPFTPKYSYMMAFLKAGNFLFQFSLKNHNSFMLICIFNLSFGDSCLIWESYANKDLYDS